ncbi:unnamed protein product [Moneuplotes crassus]|uniref:Uncharacterized protein n=1 Tax=Euplotes crassus TaxID=5936 RepID=A0AAD2D614_EUPCR|nr:unnamed protein product [Moneuplotes crassus]
MASQENSRKDLRSPVSRFYMGSQASLLNSPSLRISRAISTPKSINIKNASKRSEMELFWMSNIGSNFGEALVDLMYDSKEGRLGLEEIESKGSVPLLSRASTPSCSTSKEYRRLSRGCLNMISNYVNTILGNKLENSVKVSCDSNNSQQLCSQKNNCTDLMLTKSILLKSQDISKKARELLKDDSRFIQEQVNSYFVAFEEMMNGSTKARPEETKTIQGISNDSEPKTLSHKTPSLKSNCDEEQQIARSSFSSTSEKFRNLPSGDMNLIKQKVKEYYECYDPRCSFPSDSSTSEKFRNLPSGDLNLIKQKVQEYYDCYNLRCSFQSDSSTSEKFRNLPNEDQNFIKQKVQEYYDCYNPNCSPRSNSSTSEKVNNLNSSDWSMIREVVKDYLSASISNYSLDKIRNSSCLICDRDAKIEEEDSDPENQLTSQMQSQIKDYLEAILVKAENNILRELREEEKDGFIDRNFQSNEQLKGSQKLSVTINTERNREQREVDITKAGSKDEASDEPSQEQPENRDLSEASQSEQKEEFIQSAIKEIETPLGDNQSESSKKTSNEEFENKEENFQEEIKEQISPKTSELSPKSLKGQSNTDLDENDEEIEEEKLTTGQKVAQEQETPEEIQEKLPNNNTFVPQKEIFTDNKDDNLTPKVRRSQDTSNLSLTESEKKIAHSYIDELTNKSVMVCNTKEKTGVPLIIGDNIEEFFEDDTPPAQNAAMPPQFYMKNKKKSSIFEHRQQSLMKVNQKRMSNLSHIRRINNGITQIKLKANPGSKMSNFQAKVQIPRSGAMSPQSNIESVKRAYSRNIMHSRTNPNKSKRIFRISKRGRQVKLNGELSQKSRMNPASLSPLQKFGQSQVEQQNSYIDFNHPEKYIPKNKTIDEGDRAEFSPQGSFMPASNNRYIKIYSQTMKKEMQILRDFRVNMMNKRMQFQRTAKSPPSRLPRLLL